MSEWQMPQNKISMATSFGFGSRLSMVMGASGLPAAGTPQAGIFFISVAPGWRKPATGVDDREAIAGAKPTRTGWAVQETFTMLCRRSMAALLAGLPAVVAGMGWRHGRRKQVNVQAPPGRG